MRRSVIVGCAVALVCSACTAASTPSSAFAPAATSQAQPSTSAETASMLQSPSPSATSAPPSPAASVSPEVAACQTNSSNPLTPVLAISHGTTGMILLVGSAEVGPEDPPPGPKLLLSACRWERVSDGVQVMDVTSAIVLAEAPATASVDFGMQAGMDHEQLVVGGRAAPAVAAVRLGLRDGSVVDAVVSNGYWTAWWLGAPMALTIEALDATGAVMSSTSIDPMATPTLEPGG